MKNILYKKLVIFGIMMVFIVPACTNLEEELYSTLTQDELFENLSPEAIASSKASAYTSLVGNWGGHNSLWSLNEVSSDEMAITQKGPDWEDGQQWIRVHRHEYRDSEQSVNNGWVYCYSSISTINRLIRIFNEGNPELVSELKVLRAMVYFWLLDNYGNVPIVDETSTTPTPVTNTRTEVFQFVESEILANIDGLTEDKTYATINKWVAHTVLAKLYLNAGIYTGTDRWQDAIDQADEVIMSGLYSLENNYFANFNPQNEGSNENIFVIPYDEVNAPGFNLPQMTLHYASQATFNLQDQPWNGYSSLQEFYESFDQDDDRINSFLEGPQFASDGTRLEDASAEAGDPDGPPLTFTPEINELFPGALRQAGVRVGKWEYELGAANSINNDFAIYRYSDILLTKAEALWRLNPADGDALDLVNEIRERSNATAFGSLDADNLLAERGREFFAEAMRRQDLIRFGRYNDAWWEKPVSTPDKNIFPIPRLQIEANPELDQNPGYN